MKIGLQILAVYLLSCLVIETNGQNETYLQPFSSKLISNPAFAGFDKITNFNTGNQYYFLSEESTYNLFYASFDGYSPKLRGGIGLWFQHGLIGNANTSTTELGLSYAGFDRKIGEGNIRFTMHASGLIASKQWFTYILDQIFIAKGETPSPPGKQFNRYFLLKPGIGFLYSANSFTFGVNGKIPFEFNMSNDGAEGYQKSENVPISLNLYLAKKIGGNRKGLKSSPFEATPELSVFYNQEYILSRASLTFIHTNKTFGAFIQNDFTYNIHSVGGTLGYRSNNLHINLNTGVGLPGISDNIGVTCELSLNIIIPPIHYSKQYPWASEKMKKN